MTDANIRAQHVADQSTARALAALDDVIRALSQTDQEAIETAVIEYGKASYAAGWDQAHADLQAIVQSATGVDIGAGGA